jgi:hypothetical protein
MKFFSISLIIPVWFLTGCTHQRKLGEDIQADIYDGVSAILNDGLEDEKI